MTQAPTRKWVRLFSLTAAILGVFLVQVCLNTRLHSLQNRLDRVERAVQAEDNRHARLVSRVEKSFHPDEVFRRWGRDGWVRVNPEKVPLVTVALASPPRPSGEVK